MGFLHAMTKIQIHNYSFGRQASKIYLIFLSVLLSAPPVSNLLSAPPVSRNISCCVIRVSHISGNHKCVLPKKQTSQIDIIGSTKNRKAQRQEPILRRNHSQEVTNLNQEAQKQEEKKQEAPIIGRILIGDTEKGRNNPVFLSCDFLRMVPPKNAFLSLRLPIFGSSYYQCFLYFGIAPSEARNSAEQIRMCGLLLINSLFVSSAPS